MFTLTTAIKNEILDGLAPSYNNGYIKVYSGSVPANANSSITMDAILLGTLTFDSTAFLPANSGILTANPIGGESSAVAGGTATFYRAYASNGTTVISQGLVGTSTSEFILNSVEIVLNGIIECTSLVIAI